MSAGLATREVPARVVVVTTALIALLAVTVVAGTARERSGLPAAARALRPAVASAASLLSCFEGVQDDLFGGLARGGAATPASRALASQSLRSCDVAGLRARVAAVHVPPAAPLTDAPHRQVRAELAAARSALDRAVLDAGATRDDMQAALTAPDARAADVATGYRAVRAGYETAVAGLRAAEVELERMQAGVSAVAG